MRITIGLLVVAFMCGTASLGVSASEGELIRIDPAAERLVAVALHPRHPDRLFAASERVLYESSDRGKSWEERFRLPTQIAAVDIAVNASEQPAILLATDQGLYGSFDGGQHWSHVFQGSGEGEQACTDVAFHPTQPDTALLGTHGGLFISTDGGQQWKSVGMSLAAQKVVQIAFHPEDADRLYLVTDKKLFVGSLTTGQWQERFGVLGAEETGVEESEETETGEDNGSLHRLSAVVVDSQMPSTLYLATSRGLERSTDDGFTWQRLSRLGLESMRILRLLLQRHSPLVIYAATDQGLARYESDHDLWSIVASGLAMSRINDLAASSQQIWAATDHGLYRYQMTPEEFGSTEPPSAQDLLANFVSEPTIAQVQEAAIRYAEVHPDKIKRWRRQAALQALLPSLNFGWDRKRTLDTSIDKGAFPKFQLINTEDHNAGFDVSVKWDFGDLIWNPEQTTIDIRSKLMVQLRDDIVDEVTRTYFERRRLQITLLIEPPSDQHTILEKELRLQELTARLDGLTGGYFSQHLRVTNKL